MYKTDWIKEGREQGAYALIIYADHWYNEKYCRVVRNRECMSSEYDMLVDDGYKVLEEIFL